MKRIIYILSSILAVVGVTSCEDYLGIKPRGFDVTEKIEHYEGLLFGTEMFMLDEVFPFMCYELTIDEDGFATAYSMVGAAATNAYMWKADIFRADENCGEWNQPANCMYPLNMVVNDVMSADGPEEKKIELQAEARVCRAYMTFMMAQFFGKPYDPATADSDLCVPIITKASTVGQKFPRETVSKVYDFVLDEMKEAVPQLPARQEHPNRIFRTAGNTMYGKVLWMMGRYEEALTYLEEAVLSLDDAGCGFMDYNTIVSDGEITYPTDILQNPELLYSYNTMTHIWSAMYPSYYGSTLFTIKTDVIQKYFSKGDYRLCFISGLKSAKTAYNRFDGTDAYHLNLSNFVTNIGVTVPDLYLMYAECLARNKRYEDAREALEKLRANRLDSNTSAAVTVEDGDALIRFAVDERMREHMGYGNTWFDMRRLWDDPLFQDMKQMYVHTVGEEVYTLTEERLTMRIPPSIKQWHPEYIDNE